MSFNSTPGRASYSASAGQTLFTFSFKIFNTGDIKVYKTDAGTFTATPLTEVTDYSVSINGDLGGTVTLTTGATLNDTITLVRELDITRTIEYQANGDLNSSTLNSDQEYQTYLISDAKTTTDRSIKIKESETGFNTELPEVIAGYIAKVNDARTGFEFIDPAGTSLFKDSFIVSNIDSIRFIDTSTYSTALVRGYYSANDGGGGIFNWDASVDKSTANAGTIIDPYVSLANQGTGVGLGCWVRQYSGSVNVKWFGAKGDGSTDDGASIINAIASSQVIFIPSGIYRTSQTISIPAGKKILGEGRGDNPLAIPDIDSVISYSGTGVAISMDGHMSGIEDVAIYDYLSTAAVGLLSNGDANSIESSYAKNILIYGFSSGIGHKVMGINSGYVAYALFENIRMRNCLTGLYIEDAGGGAGFVNTNQWIGGAISAGNYDYGIHINGGNNNKFVGMSVECTTANNAVIYIESGAIEFDGRVEMTTSSTTIPVIETTVNAVGGYLKGLGADGIIINRGTTNIQFSSAKAPQYNRQSMNIVENPAFSNSTSTTVYGWTIAGAGISIASVVSNRFNGLNKLTITVPAGITFTMKQYVQTNFIGLFGDRLNVGAFVSSPSGTHTVSFSMDDDVAGVTAGSQHLNDGTEYWIGAGRNVPSNATWCYYQFNIVNNNATPIDVTIVQPSAMFGEAMLYPSPTPLTSASAKMYGLLSEGYGTDAVATSLLKLKLDGNIFNISGTTTISRINDAAIDPRFPKGSKITLIFTDACSVASGAYIILKSAFTSVAGNNDSLHLMSLGTGVWIEIGRSV